MIQIESLSVLYGSLAALKGINLNVAPGECVLITGPSGCGKTALARAIGGLIPHAIPAKVEGKVTVDGLDVAVTPLPHLAQRVGFVFQNPSTQLFHLSVAEEVAFGPRNLGLLECEIASRVEDTLKTLDLDYLKDRRPAELSGGQQQRVAIAAALAMHPQVLILDEPAASLDVAGTHAIVNALRELRKLGMTLVIIEHRLAEMLPLADRLIIMADGRIEADAPPQALTSDRNLLRSLGLRRPAEAISTPWDELLIPNGHPRSERPLLQLQNIRAGYGRSKPILKDINLDFYPGEFIALVGENGAGKSTLGLVIAGLLKPSQGQVRFDSRRPQPGLDVGLLFQNPTDQLFTESVDEEVAFGPRNFRRYHPERHQEILNIADLTALRTRPPFALSSGQQQRTAMSAVAALNPHLLILDEPTLGQDWGHLERLMDFLSKLNQRGTAILLITHDYKLVHHYARRVIMLHDGQVQLDGHLRSQGENDKHEIYYS